MNVERARIWQHTYGSTWNDLLEFGTNSRRERQYQVGSPEDPLDESAHEVAPRFIESDKVSGMNLKHKFLPKQFRHNGKDTLAVEAATRRYMNVYDICSPYVRWPV
jgi:hypothetical protein